MRSRLIEEFMVLAQMSCAAETRIAKKTPLAVQGSMKKGQSSDEADALRQRSATSGLVLAKGQV